MDFDLPADDDPRRLAVRAWLAANPHPTGRQLAEAGYVVPHWPAPWGLDADPMHQLIIDDELRRAGVGAAEQRDRDRLGGADDPAGRHRRAEAALPAADLERRGVLVPAVQRARLRLRPGQPRDPRRARRRRVRDQRLEDLVERCPPRAVRHPHRPYRPERAQAQGHLVLHLPDGHARAVDEPDRRHDDGALVQPGVLRRHAHSCLAPRRRRGRRVAARQGHARQRAGVAVVGRLAVGRRAHRPQALLDLVRQSVEPAAASTIRWCAIGSPGCTARPRCCGSTGCAASVPRCRAARRAPRRRSRRSWPTSTVST